MDNLWQLYYDSGLVGNEWATGDSGDGNYYGFHAVNDILANTWFGATSTWKFRTYLKYLRSSPSIHIVDHYESGWSSYETAYDREVMTDPARSANGARPVLARTDPGSVTGGFDVSATHTGSAHSLRATSTSISRHGRDAIVDGIIGAVKVANTYSADYKATYWNGSSYVNWITSGAGYDTATPKNTYYALNHKTLRYRPAKSQGASPETQMYSAYFGAPYNRWSDSTPFFAGLNSAYTSTGNYWEGDILPGMCKADNALTNWGTVDLSKFDESHIGYRWHNDAWFDNDRSGLARSIIWSPSNANTFFSEGTPSGGITDSGRSIPEGRKGMGRDYFGYHEDRSESTSYSQRWNKYRITAHQKGGTYDGFKLHERPEFQPVSGDGRYFGGVGGVDNWGGTSYNTWGPGMCVSPTVWDLKWSGIQHPFNVSPSAEEDSNTFYNATSIENQTSYIGGAPNVRVLLGDNGGTFKYSNGTEVSGTGYDAANTWSATPMNYDWAIGSPQIQSNYWDRTLKTKEFERTDGFTGRLVQHANNGIQAPLSLKVKACYRQTISSLPDSAAWAAASNLGGETYCQVWILEDNLGFDSLNGLGWEAPDKIKLENAPAEWDLPDDGVELLNASPGVYEKGVRYEGHSTTLPRDYQYGPIAVITKPIRNKSGGLVDDLTSPTSHLESPSSDLDLEYIENNPQLVAHNQTLAADSSRHPTGAFKANTTYHFQYMYDETKINPPKYKYWVLRIPAGVDAYNGEPLPLGESLL